MDIIEEKIQILWKKKRFRRTNKKTKKIEKQKKERFEYLH